MKKEIIYGNVPSKSNCYKIITLGPKNKRYSSLGKTKALKDYEKFDKMQRVLEGISLISFKEYIYSERNPWVFLRGVGLQLDNPMDFATFINIDAPSRWGDNPRKGMAEQFKKDFY